MYVEQEVLNIDRELADLTLLHKIFHMLEARGTGTEGI